MDQTLTHFVFFLLNIMEKYSMSALTRNMIRCGVILLRIGETADLIVKIVQELVQELLVQVCLD